ncbi:MAG: efflux RND transporter permease subunit, partial [Melioribacteraceae bacterium]|nr:efflux RND transporter permease subunit [Melioribacteraceae bacterium]
HSQIENILGKIPELEYKFVQSETPLAQILGTDDFPIVVEVSGEDLDIIEDLTNNVHQNISKISSLVNVESSFAEGTPVVEIEVDRLTTGIYNIGLQQITTQLQDKLMGKKSGRWDFDGEMNNITLKLPDVSIKQLGNLIIANGQSEYRLSELATITKTTSPKEIYRRNQIRIGKVTAQIVGDKSLDQIVKEINTQLENIEFPLNYKVQIAGEEMMRKESMSNLTFALLLSIILVYMALASQFESLVHPFTILLTIPLAGVGAILTFFIIGMPLNIMAFIGIIMLGGIAVNDSIILVDAINQLKNEGFSLRDSIIRAGEKRIRPIIMTSLTTILALLPLTFGFGESASLRSPMAYAVIGGLITSTLLTLIVIPSVYYIFESFVSKFKSPSIERLRNN